MNEETLKQQIDLYFKEIKDLIEILFISKAYKYFWFLKIRKGWCSGFKDDKDTWMIYKTKFDALTFCVNMLNWRLNVRDLNKFKFVIIKNKRILEITLKEVMI